MYILNHQFSGTYLSNIFANITNMISFMVGLDMVAESDCVLLLCYAIATIFQLYHSSDMMYEVRMRKPEPTLLPTQWIFNLPHPIGMA